MTYKINMYDKDNPQLEILIQSNRTIVSFSVAMLSPEDREWLGGILDREFEEQIRIAVQKALYNHQKSLRCLLGIHEPQR